MKEKEVKILNVNFESIEQKLIQAGALLIKDEEQTNWIFSIDALKTDIGEKGYLRLRSTRSRINGHMDHEFTLKMKETNQEIRVYEEWTAHIMEPETLIEIMKLIGHPVQYKGEKARKSYLWEGIAFEMDQWDADTYPYPYLEIEMQTENDLQRALDLLGCSKADVTTKSISELRREWREEYAD